MLHIYLMWKVKNTNHSPWCIILTKYLSTKCTETQLLPSHSAAMAVINPVTGSVTQHYICIWPKCISVTDKMRPSQMGASINNDNIYNPVLILPLIKLPLKISFFKQWQNHKACEINFDIGTQYLACEVLVT